MEDLLKKLSRVEAFYKVYLETDENPRGDDTSGWTAGVRIGENTMEPDSPGFIGFYSEVPSQAVRDLVDVLLEKEYITREDIQ